MKTCLYNFDPLKPHFYIVKLGFTGVYIIFLISAQKHRLWVLATKNPHSMFWAEIWKISEFFYLRIFSFWRWNFLYLNRRVFVMYYHNIHRFYSFALDCQSTLEAGKFLFHIAPDNTMYTFSIQKVLIFFYFYTKNMLCVHIRKLFAGPS